LNGYARLTKAGAYLGI